MAPSTGVAAAPGAGLTYTPSTSGRSGSNIYGTSGTTTSYGNSGYGSSSSTGATPGYGGSGTTSSGVTSGQSQTAGAASSGYPSGYSSFTPASAAAAPRCSATVSGSCEQCNSLRKRWLFWVALMQVRCCGVEEHCACSALQVPEVHNPLQGVAIRPPSPCSYSETAYMLQLGFLFFAACAAVIQ